MSNEQRSNVKHRPKISCDDLSTAQYDIGVKLHKRMKEKGNGAWLSRHEILGILTEEKKEVIDAVHGGTLDELRKELIDVAVGCIFGIACIDQKTLDW